MQIENKRQDYIYLNDEFEKIWTKIEQNENFALLRFGDGERAIMQGRSVTAQEGWKSPKYISQLGKDLLNSLQINDDNFFYGISCPCCDKEAYYWYSTRITNKNRTFANLFVNKNYQKFLKKFESLNRDCVVIGNHEGQNSKIANLNILKYYPIPDNCFDFWEKKGKNLLKQIKCDFGNKNDLLYVVSAGPLSEPIITELFRNNPHNCYIDFGSSVDKWIHNKQTRPYEDSKSEYAQKNCKMHNPRTTDFDISVVLTLYKRPQYLEQQLKALEKQSVKPKEILLFQDKATGTDISIPNNLTFDKIEIAKTNIGVWGRFDFARQNAKSRYVCIFDDDTIPGSRWLENCLSESLKRKGLYGGIGIICKNDKYEDNSFYRTGWSNNTEITMEVDFVGHSWFLEKNWLEWLFENTEKFQKYKICGEDMTLSFKLQEHNINTYVPPQPINKIELTSSLYGTKAGTDKNSLFVNNGYTKMNEIFNLLIQEGFLTLKYRNELLYSAYTELLFKVPNKNKNKIKWVQQILSVKNSEDKRYKIVCILGIKIKIPKKCRIKT